MKLKKISIITGVAGTIGSNLANFLINKNHFIYGFDNLILGKKNNIKNILKNKNFKFIKCDVSNASELKKKILKIKKIDYLWLLAANSDIRKGTNNRLVDLQNTFLTNYTSLKLFNKKLKKNGTVIFSSSSAVYGKSDKKFKEDQKRFLPESNYGESKLISEIYIRKFCTINKIKYLIIRYPNVVGKPFTHGVIFDLAKKINNNKILKVLGNGNQKKPYAHVKEIIQCMYYLINKKKLSYNTYLVGPGGDGTKVKTIVNTLKKYFKMKNKKVLYEKKKIGWKGDIPVYNYNVNRLKKEGFYFKYSSLDAVKLALKERYKN